MLRLLFRVRDEFAARISRITWEHQAPHYEEFCITLKSIVLSTRMQQVFLAFRNTERSYLRTKCFELDAHCARIKCNTHARRKRCQDLWEERPGRLFHFENDIRAPLYYPPRVKETSCVISSSFSPSLACVVPCFSSASETSRDLSWKYIVCLTSCN